MSAATLPTTIASTSTQTSPSHSAVHNLLHKFANQTFNVGDSAYGAVGDGSTDDAAAIQAALNDAESTAGIVVVPASNTPYMINSGLTIPRNVSLISLGGYAQIKAGAAMDSMTSVPADSVGGPAYAHAGNRYGRCEGIHLHGDGLANKCWDIGGVVQRSWWSCIGEGALDANWVLNASQNCKFFHCDSDNAAAGANGGGLRLNHGAGGNIWVGGEFDNNAGHALVFCQSDVLDADPGTSSFASPSYNRFIGLSIERDPAGYVSLVRARAGVDNAFYSCGFSAVPGTLFEVTSADANCSTWRFYDCAFSGDSTAGTVAMHLESAWRWTFKDCAFQGVATTFEMDDASLVLVDSGCNHTALGGGTTWFSALGALPERALIMYDSTNYGPSGYRVTSQGTGTIASGATNVDVTHSLATTPSNWGIYVTPTNSPTNDPGNIWVSNIGATTFRVNCRNDPGAGGLTFAWRARIL